MTYKALFLRAVNANCLNDLDAIVKTHNDYLYKSYVHNRNRNRDSQLRMP